MAWYDPPCADDIVPRSHRTRGIRALEAPPALCDAVACQWCRAAAAGKSRGGGVQLAARSTATARRGPQTRWAARSPRRLGQALLWTGQDYVLV